MRQLMIIVGMTLVAVSAMAQRVAFSFSNSPLRIVLNEYSQWTGKKVEIVQKTIVAVIAMAVAATASAQQTNTLDSLRQS